VKTKWREFFLISFLIFVCCSQPRVARAAVFLQGPGYSGQLSIDNMDIDEADSFFRSVDFTGAPQTTLIHRFDSFTGGSAGVTYQSGVSGLVPGIGAGATPGWPAISAGATAGVSVTPQGPNDIAFSGVARASVTYSVMAVGPPGTVPVDVFASGRVTTPNNNPDEIARFDIRSSIPNSLSLVSAEAGAGQSPASFNVSMSVAGKNALNVTAGDILTVTMFVLASAAVSGVDSTCGFCLILDYGSAEVDPIIQIDPSSPNASKYSLLFSPGIGTGPVVTPLPAALPLFATGLGALGLLGWRRKRKALDIRQSV
jgi:hypothetical protein